MSEPQHTESRAPRALHPVLWAIYPILGLYAYNLEKTPLSAMGRPILAAAIVALGLTALFAVLFRGRLQGAWAAAVLIFASLPGWRLYSNATSMPDPGLPRWALLGLYAVLAAAAVYLVWRYLPGGVARRKTMARALAGAIAAHAVTAALLLRPLYGFRDAWVISAFGVGTVFLLAVPYLLRADMKLLTRALNYFAVVLVALSLANIALHWPGARRSGIPEHAPAIPPETVFKPNLPDIYLIVLDGYGRGDMLAEIYGIDDSEFMSAMTQRGFVHARQSSANYPRTVTSLASMLNMTYLDGLLSREAIESGRLAAPAALIHESEVHRVLEQAGYEIVMFSPGVELLEPRAGVTEIKDAFTLSEFELVLCENAFWLTALRKSTRPALQRAASIRASQDRRRIRFTLDNIEILAAEVHDRPRFALAYLTIPGLPFLFDANGNPYPAGLRHGASPGEIFRGPKRDFINAYEQQLRFTGAAAIKAVDAVLQATRRRCVILVLSARGPGPGNLGGAPSNASILERFANLLLVRYPEDLRAPSEWERMPITLVNVFRRVLRDCVLESGTALDDLPNERYVDAAANQLEFHRID